MLNSFDVKTIFVIIPLVHSIESDMTEVTEHDARLSFCLTGITKVNHTELDLHGLS